MLLGLEGEGVNVDTSVAGNVLVVLEGLDQVEVGTITLSEAVVTVQLQLGSGGHVGSSGGVGGPRVGGHGGGDTNPDQLLHGVVEVELDAVVAADEGLITSELQLGDQVLVGQLSEAAALVSVQEDVVNPQGGGRQIRGRNGGGVLAQGVLVLELQVDLDFVVLHVDTLPFGIFLRSDTKVSFLRD